MSCSFDPQLLVHAIEGAFQCPQCGAYVYADRPHTRKTLEIPVSSQELTERMRVAYLQDYRKARG